MQQDGNGIENRQNFDNRKSNKYWIIAIVVLSILAVTGFILAIIGFNQEEKPTNTKNSSTNNVTVTAESSSYNTEEKTQKWIEVLANKVTEGTSMDNNSIYHDIKDNKIYYKPNYLSTRVAGTGYEHVLYLMTEDENLANILREVIKNELAEEGLKVEEQIIYEEDKYDLYVSKDEDVLCKMGNDTTTLVMCSNISSQYPEEGSGYANEINQLAEAYKEKISSYPSLVNLKSGWTQGGEPYIITVSDNENSTRYEILVNGLNFAIPHYFYRTENGAWVYPTCDNGLNSEEENLFECIPYGTGPDNNALPTIPALKVGNGVRV